MKKLILAVLLSVSSLFGQAHSAALSWTPGAGSSPTGYYIYKGPGSGQESTAPINSSPVTATTYTDTSVSAGTRPCYFVEALVGTASSGPSNEACGTIPVNPPTNAAVSIAGSTATVTWTASTDGAAAYNIFAGTTSGGEGTTPVNASPVAAGCSGATCTYQITGIGAGVSEFIEVQAVINGVSSPSSNQASATGSIPTPVLSITVK